jgi:predicted DNA binding CopG/RHH family protein
MRKKRASYAQSSTIVRAVSPEEALDFLESIRRMQEDKDEPTKLISVRVPENILRALKVKAKFENKKYQSLLIQYLREGLRTSK